MNLIKVIFKNSVLFQSKHTEFFNTSSAVRQGSALTKILFNDTMDEIANKIKEEKKNLGLKY
jgi:retron-type reverse transcriptase